MGDGGGGFSDDKKKYMHSVFKLDSVIIISHFTGYHPFSAGGRADKARYSAESHYCLWHLVGVWSTLCLQPTEEQCKERQTYL